MIDQLPELRTTLLIAIPACCDLTASTLGFIGLLYISASVWQMLRGSMVVFSGILSVLFLNRKMHSYNWAGIGLCVAGIVVVGAANTLATASSTAVGTSENKSDHNIGGGEVQTQEDAQLLVNRLCGMSLVILGQLVQAAQVVVEEKILTDAKDLPPAIVVGLEGMWGFLILTVVGFPLLYVLPGSDYGGCQENLLDTFAMLQSSGPLCAVVVLYLFTCSSYNLCGMCITRYLNAVHRTMLDAWRTMVIWITGIAYFYAVDSKSDFGEPWTPFSWLQLFGFLVLIFGQLVYGGLVRIPSLFTYDDGTIVASPSPVNVAGVNVANKMNGFNEVSMSDYISPASALHLVISPDAGHTVGPRVVSSGNVGTSYYMKLGSSDKGGISKGARKQVLFSQNSRGKKEEDTTKIFSSSQDSNYVLVDASGKVLSSVSDSLTSPLLHGA